MFWPPVIGLAVSLFKTFATSAAQNAGGAVGTRIGNAVFAHAGQAQAQNVIAAAEPQASHEQRVSASQELLAALRANEAFRDEVRAILAEDDPEALQAGDDVKLHLESAPAEVEEVVSGTKPVTDYLDPLWIWKTLDSPPLSAPQVAFLRSPTFHKACPVGHEDLGPLPDVRYHWDFGGTTQDVNLPTVVLPAPPEAIYAVCKNGHRWPVFAP